MGFAVATGERGGGITALLGMAVASMGWILGLAAAFFAMRWVYRRFR